jgi:hypothetical protein
MELNSKAVRRWLEKSQKLKKTAPPGRIPASKSEADLVKAHPPKTINSIKTS